MSIYVAHVENEEDELKYLGRYDSAADAIDAAEAMYEDSLLAVLEMRVVPKTIVHTLVPVYEKEVETEEAFE